MTIYVDIVFLENFVLNFIIITSTSILTKAKIKIKRTAISSILGSFFSVFNYIVKFNQINNLIFKLFISIIMVYVVFGKLKAIKFLERILLFYIVSFTYGGISFMFLVFLKPQNLIIENNHYLGTYPIKIALISGIFGFFIIILLAIIIKNRNNPKDLICDLEIFYKGKCKKIKTMLDTGNLLKEPITKSDVIIVEKQSLVNIVSNDILENLNSIINGKWIDGNNVYSYKFILIPFSSLGNENGLLIGFKPDYIKIYREEEYVINNVLIGIYDGKLSKTNLYTSLIGLGILNKEVSKDEYFENI